MDKIIDNLYLGDIRAAANLFLLKQHVSDPKDHKKHKKSSQSLLTNTFASRNLGRDSHFASASRPEPLLPFSKF